MNGAMRDGRCPKAPEAKSQMSEALTAMTPAAMHHPTTWLAVVLTKGLPMMRSEEVMVSSCTACSEAQSASVEVPSSGQLLKHTENRSRSKLDATSAMMCSKAMVSSCK